MGTRGRALGAAAVSDEGLVLPVCENPGLFSAVRL